MKLFIMSIYFELSTPARFQFSPAQFVFGYVRVQCSSGLMSFYSSSWYILCLVIDHCGYIFFFSFILIWTKITEEHNDFPRDAINITIDSILSKNLNWHWSLVAAPRLQQICSASLSLSHKSFVTLLFIIIMNFIQIHIHCCCFCFWYIFY